LRSATGFGTVAAMSQAHRVHAVERVDLAAGSRRGDDDAVVEEAALSVTARGREVMVVMRTPGDDLALVRGLLHAEGIAEAASAGLRVAGPDAVDVDLPPERFAARATSASAGCGVCGRTTVDDLLAAVAPVTARWLVAAVVVAGLPARLRAAQATFDVTGGLHAAALCTPAGELVAVREDVGRHNAVDKLVGWGLATGLDLGGVALVLSGRLGFELAHKAARAGIPLVAAVSAPSSLALQVCERAGVTACGFVRGPTFNVYCHGWRVAGP
jgi:FdhD protein